VENPVDIIKVLTGEHLAWVEAADEADSRNVRVLGVAAILPGEYLIFNQEKNG